MHTLYAHEIFTIQHREAIAQADRARLIRDVRRSRRKARKADRKQSADGSAGSARRSSWTHAA